MREFSLSFGTRSHYSEGLLSCEISQPDNSSLVVGNPHLQESETRLAQEWILVEQTPGLYTSEMMHPCTVGPV